MSCASRRVNITFIRGCGSSRENARVSGLVANFRAITSNGGASVTSLRWSGATIWQGTHLIAARRRPLSASAASAADATKIPATGQHKRSSRTKASVDNLRAGFVPRGSQQTQAAIVPLREIHAFLIQIKIQQARGSSLRRFVPIGDNRLSVSATGESARADVQASS